MTRTSPIPVELDALFADGVATAEVRLDEPLEDLFPEEEEAVGRARPERVLEFRAGRHAARRALSRLGLAPSVIQRNPDRSPAWPAGVAGSITHVRREGIGWAGAAAARADVWAAVGLDAEVDSPLEPALWRRVLTADEMERVMSLPEEDRGHRAKLIFSAKECVYKCQYALTRQFLDFADVEVEISGDRFLARFRPESVRDAVRGPLEGRHVRRHGLVVTGAALRQRT